MHQMCISTTQVSSVMLRSKKLEIRENKCENWKSCRLKIKQEYHEIEPNPSKDRGMPEGDNPSFCLMLEVKEESVTWYSILIVLTAVLFIYRGLEGSLLYHWLHFTALCFELFWDLYIHNISDFQIFRAEFQWRDVSYRNVHLVHQNWYCMIFTFNHWVEASAGGLTTTTKI
jgi:hypothetical protein